MQIVSFKLTAFLAVLLILTGCATAPQASPPAQSATPISQAAAPVVQSATPIAQQATPTLTVTPLQPAASATIAPTRALTATSAPSATPSALAATAVPPTPDAPGASPVVPPGLIILQMDQAGQTISVAQGSIVFVANPQPSLAWKIDTTPEILVEIPAPAGVTPPGPGWFLRAVGPGTTNLSLTSQAQCAAPPCPPNVMQVGFTVEVR